MTGETLFTLLGALPDDLILEAELARPSRRKPQILKWTALAACAAFAIFLGSMLLGPLSGMGTTEAPAQTPPLLADSGAGQPESAPTEEPATPESAPAESLAPPQNNALCGYPNFTHYESPILPLSIENSADALTAARHTTLTLLKNGESVSISDAYTLQNSTSEPRTVPISYAVATSLQNLEQLLPTLYVNTQPMQTTLQIAPTRLQLSGETVQAQPPQDWQAYAALWAAPATHDAAAAAAFLQQSVTVYTLTDITGRDTYDDGTLTVSYNQPANATSVHYGFASYGGDAQTGRTELAYFLSHKNSPRIAFLNAAPETITVRGYAKSGDSQTVPAITARLQPETMPLADYLLRCLTDYQTDHPLSTQLSSSDLLAAVAQPLRLLPSGTLPQSLDECFQTAFSATRIVRVQTTITVPANAALTVSAQYTKPVSYHYPGTGSHARGFELLNVDATAPITSQTATLTLPDGWQIAAQNFEFPPTGGESTLNPATKYYYLTLEPNKTPTKK